MAPVFSTVSSTDFNWRTLFIPAGFIKTIQSDITTFKNVGFNLKDEKVKAAGLRSLCLLGMAITACLFGSIAWGVFWGSIKVIVQIVALSAAYLTCRCLFERQQITTID